MNFLIYLKNVMIVIVIVHAITNYKYGKIYRHKRFKLIIRRNKRYTRIVSKKTKC